MQGRKGTDFVTVKDVPAWDFIVAYADHLKKTSTIKVPENYDLIKTGVGKELAPYSEDWFYIRAAAVARKIYLRPQLGVGRMRHIFGHKRSNGSAREHHSKVSSKNIRDALHALEGADILMRFNDARNKAVGELPEGDSKLFRRIVSPNGQRTINEIAKNVFSQLVGKQ